MEAPEKIYLHPDIGDREFIKPWLKKPFNENSVEYTRTDAFIEKACGFFSNLPHYFYDNGNGNVFVDYVGLITDFKKAMEE